jgi:hypothetical protein
MDPADQKRLAGIEMAEDLFSAPFVLQAAAWRSYLVRHCGNLVDDLERFRQALARYIDERDRGLTQGGPEGATPEDVERVRRLAELLATDPASTEIDPLARRLLEVLGGDAAELPPPPA